MAKTAVIIPCYKRPEYTKICLEAVEQAQEYKDVVFYLYDDGSDDGTAEVLGSSRLNSIVTIRKENSGLRNTIIDFFEEIKDKDFKYITKIDNDCLVPKNWLNDLTEIFEEAGCDVLSPNVSETNAAHKYGSLNLREGKFIPSKFVGGLWFMRIDLIDDIFFEKIDERKGIRAAFNIINQIVAEKDPKIGWTDAVTYDDVGFWSGSHPSHLKTQEHANYSKQIGRRIAWTPEVV